MRKLILNLSFVKVLNFDKAFFLATNSRILKALHAIIREFVAIFMYRVEIKSGKINNLYV
ncbi:hypothetical protein RT99_09175 [Flavobacterium sp. MEB061]|nr:hypothetical protein RT99_09175 [Flavobacterium sp. MEB061]